MKLKIFFNIITIFMILLGLGFFYIQVICGGNYLYLSEKNRLRIIPEGSCRGRILDRNGLTLVDSRVSFNIVIVPRDLMDKEKIVSALSEILGTSKEKTRLLIDRAIEKSMYQPSVIFEDVPKEKAFSIEERIFEFPGIIVEVKPVRNYVYGDVGSHIFGYLGEVNRPELEGLRAYGYRLKDLLGRSGLEKFYDAYLRGEDGGINMEVDSLGRRIKVMGFKPPKSGGDLELTIDMRLQSFADKALNNLNGAIVAMNPKTGEILAMVSAPDFDPNIFVSSGNNENIKKVLLDKSRPLVNKAISAHYPPGSVFKIVTSSCGLETGKIKKGTSFNCTGKFVLGRTEFGCWQEGGHGILDLPNALKYSCNVYVYNVGKIVGIDDLANYAMRFGFGRPTGIDLPDEIPGIVPGKIWKAFAKGELWYEGETLNVSIGQGALSVTPIQVVRMVSAIANNGEMVQPYIVKKIGIVNIRQTKTKNLNFSPQTINAIKEGLKKVVQDEGTGKRANVEGLSIAGKTSTAQAGSGRVSHGWFAGFAPFEDPKLAVVVFLEHGGKGGLNPAQIAGEIFKEAKKDNLL